MYAIALLPVLLLQGAETPSSHLRLTVEQAADLAVTVSPALRSARARSHANEDQAKSMRGRLLPTVNVSDEWQRWDSTFEPSLGPGASLRARDLNTNMFVVSAGQPLLGLLHLSSDHGALTASAQATAYDVKTLEANLREDIRTQFIRMFEAHALAGVARASQAQLGEQLVVAKEKLSAGVLTPADVLRLNVAVANAKQQEIQADAAEQVARTSLLLALGQEAQDTTIEFVEPTTPDSVENVDGDLRRLLAKAVASRSEIRSADLVARSADRGARSRAYALLPDVDLEAGYLHSTGQTFVKTNSAFVGLKANWQIWDWGARWYQHRQADAQAEAAREQARETRRRVETEVAAKLANVKATASALDTGRTAIGSAEEAYRVTTVLLGAGSANTTDLLDAQSALTQARLNFARSRYEYALARMQLERALGE
jgi:outer membrane protein